MSNPFNADYYLRGKETGISNYTNYSWMPEPTLKMAQVVKYLLNIKQNETILDFGCARGFLVKALRLLEVKAFGVDISEWAINNCDEEVRPFVELTPDNNLYDHIFSKDVLEHIPNLEEVLPRLLKQCNKSCLFIVPLTKEEGGNYIYPNDELDKTHIHRHTMNEWTDMFNLYGSDFVIFSSYYVPFLKINADKYPGSTGFFYLKRLK